MQNDLKKSMPDTYRFFTKHCATGIFLLWCALILGAIGIIQPGWGFMDDHSNLMISRGFWEHASWKGLSDLFIQDLGVGCFRPVYKLWIIGVYKAAEHAPVLIYFFTTLIGLALLPLWGLILDNVYDQKKRDPFLIWVYPLSFFIFTPFWNAFMYISVQERFIYLLGAPAIFFFLKSYDAKKWQPLLLSYMFVALAIMAKATGIVLIMAFMAYAFSDAVIFKRRPKASWLICAINAAMIAGYYLFVQATVASYTKKYASNANLQSIVNNLLTSPLYIKLILLLCVTIIASELFRKLVRKDLEETGVTLFAWLTIFYIIILTPWGFLPYLLAPMAPFLMAAGLFFFRRGDHILFYERGKRALLVIMLFCVGAFIIIPQVQKMADKRTVITAIRAIAQHDPAAAFFYPPPYQETLNALSFFSEKKIIYLADKTLGPNDIPAGTTPYLLVNDECSAARLSGLSVGHQAYANNTWHIYPLQRSAVPATSFKPAFTQNLMQKLKKVLKDL